eukprot:gene11227-biopygen15915
MIFSSGGDDDGGVGGGGGGGGKYHGSVRFRGGYLSTEHTGVRASKGRFSCALLFRYHFHAFLQALHVEHMRTSVHDERRFTVCGDVTFYSIHESQDG